MSTIALTASLVVEATGGRLAAGSADRVFAHVSTDTRAIVPEALFIALRGERFDGHAFVDHALAAGAGGLVVSTMPAFSVGDAA